MKNINIKGLNILEFGDEKNQALIFIHAFPMDHRMWHTQINFFQNKFRTIAYDLRGFGKSKTDIDNCMIESHTDDLFTIINEMKIVKPLICGLSMGGYIALRALERDQEIFKGAILSDTKAEADTNEAKLKRAGQIKQVKNGGREQFLEEFLNSALSKNNSSISSKIRGEIKEIMNEQSDKTICSALMTLASRTDTSAFLEKIKIPILILVGDEDKLTPPENASTMHKKITGSSLVIIQNSGHFPNFESSEKFNNTIDNFIYQIISII